MSQLNQFAKGQSTINRVAKTAVAYTRVSTKEQADNNHSLKTQIKHINLYAEKNNLHIDKEFGGTYESAKTDERIEFNKMLAYVKRHKVDTILVYSIDRFSRSGPNAVYISDQLRKLNISIMSVTQPIKDALSASGELQQNIYLVFSQYENQQRREKCMAGTKDKLLQGDWVTQPPLGYESIKRNGKKEIVINERGLLLQKAFRKKIRLDVSFKDLATWLNQRGIKVTNKRLSELARNVFYCGFMAHSALEGEVVKGNHEALLSKREFLLLNGALDSKRKNRTRVNEKFREDVVLRGHLKCAECDTFMTGYLVKRKNLWYYKCNTIGCKHNKSAKVLHQKWEEQLEGLKIDKKFIAPIVKEFNNLLESKKVDQTIEVKPLKQKQTELNKKIEAIEERFVLGEIDGSLYQKYKTKYQGQLDELNRELAKTDISLSNHKDLSKNTVKTLANLLKIWEKSNIENKKGMLNAVYPEGILVNREKTNYRTSNLNPAISCILVIASNFTKKEKRNTSDNYSYSALVARSRIEPSFL